ncbi:anti-sigma factor RsbA family regulatory protein [Pseudonocardia xinjiangensis]|uniref:anti-sigma factor RsbA family regulatory protein n=1 Tax=Pseudonocardia xinjiangensis TaxID=75289 RepID=UPI0028A85CBB|nr:anti-sigma factor RsbA family regulatory protein [Pseudonocardia xinjiangensis]
MSATIAIEPVSSREDRFGHPALFYRGLDEYLAGTLPFVHDGLAAGEPVAVAVPAARLEPLRGELGSAAERVQFLDMGEAGRNPGRILPGVLLAFAEEHAGAARVRIIGEPIWAGRSAVEYPACVQHEALINLAFAGRPATILCPYDAVGLSAEVLADAEATHPVVVDARGSRVSAAYAADRVLAEFNRPFPEPEQHRPLLVDATVLARARRLAEAAAIDAGLDEDRVADVEMVANELVTNSVEHAGGTGALRIWTEDALLVVEVRDSGQLLDPLVGRRRPDPLQRRGRGLFVVNQLADLVRLHTAVDGTTVRAYFRLP